MNNATIGRSVDGAFVFAGPSLPAAKLLASDPHRRLVTDQFRAQTAPVFLALSRPCLPRARRKTRQIINNYGWSILAYVAAALCTQKAVKGIDIPFQETSCASKLGHEGSVINC